MSDHESEVNPASPEGESMNGSFSSNGNDPGASAGVFDASETGQDMSFLDDLANAMRTTASAQQARDAELTEQRRQAHLDAIRAREALEAEDLRELAKEDVKGIDAWSDGEIKRIKLERERRIASRREQLQVRLEEHRLVVASEVEAVEAAITSYRIETERFFDRLGSQTDPVEIARQAGTRPPFPDLDNIGPQQEVAAATAAYQAPINEEPAYQPPAFGTPAASAAIEPIEAHEPVQAVTETEIEAPIEIEAQAEIADAPEPVEAVEAVEAVEIAEIAEPVLEPVIEPEPEPVAEAVETPEPEAEAVVAAAEEQVADAPIDPNQLIGVMDPEAGQVAAAATPWEPGVEATVEPAAPGDQVEDAIGAVQGSSGDSDGSDEPVSVGAEARVVMPRTTGAGSWLRWPNSSIDRSDPSR